MATTKSGGQQEPPKNYVPLAESEHLHPKGHAQLEKTDAGEKITATLILRRQQGGETKGLDYFQSTAFADRKHVSHQDFAGLHGSSQEDLTKVEQFAKSKGLEVVDSNAARRSVVVQGTAEQLNNAFAIELHHYKSALGDYHGHEGPPHLPSDISNIVELVVGLDNRKVPAKHFSMDPPHTASLTPQQVAKLYNFPSGNGAGQTIGIYEMVTGDGPPGYAQADINATIKAFGGGLTAPTPIAVSVGQSNSGTSDGETLLDITVSSAIAQGAKIAVYFTAGSNQDIIHCLQRMIHPSAGDPVPTVISISYGWSPDETTQYISKGEYTQISQLFQDAAHLGITTLISSGDSGVVFGGSIAEASYPATDPWVLACGGTTIGNVNGASFIEYVWNDSWGSGKQKLAGATGGGVSGRFSVPTYQNGFPIPKSLVGKKAGRGIPDVAGNASPVSGYPQSAGGQLEGSGGTSAVAPLYAGLIALINANLGTPVGFINPQLYALASTAFHEISGPPGPKNNSFNGVTGYPASKVWNACTGLGSINGTALQNGLKKTSAKSPATVKEEMAHT